MSDIILGVQSTVSHELKHWFQREWREEENRIAYYYRDKLGSASDLGRFSYLMSPREQDAQVSGAYNLYRRFRRRVNFVDCMFQVFLFADDQSDEIQKGTLEYGDFYFDNPADFFNFIYTVYVFIPKYSDKNWMKEKLKEDLPEFEKRFRENGGPNIDPSSIEENADRIKELIKHVETYNKKVPFQSILDELDEDSETTDTESLRRRLFCVWGSNEKTVDYIFEEYKKRVGSNERKKANENKKQSTKSIFPQRFNYLLEHINKEVALDYISTAYDEYIEDVSMDYFSKLYYIILDESPHPNRSLEDQIKADRKKNPIKTFIFYYVIYAYLIFNKPKKYYISMKRSLKAHTLELRKKKLLLTDVDIIVVFTKIQDIVEEFENQPKAVNKYIKDNFKSTNDFFNQLLFPEGKNPLYKHIKKDVLNYIASGK